MTARKINSTAGAKPKPFPNSKGALPIVPVTPGASLTGTGMKALGRTRPPNRELGRARRFTQREGQVNKVLTFVVPLSGDRDFSCPPPAGRAEFTIKLSDKDLLPTPASCPPWSKVEPRYLRTLVYPRATMGRQPMPRRRTYVIANEHHRPRIHGSRAPSA